LLTRGAELEQEWADALHSLRDCPNVIDIRNLGMIGAIELAPRAGAPVSRAYEAMVSTFEAGVLMRVTADTLAMSPPLIPERGHIDRIIETTRKVLTGLACPGPGDRNGFGVGRAPAGGQTAWRGAAAF